MKFGIGQPVRRHEDLKLITGQGRYTDDIVLPRMAQAFVLRSGKPDGPVAGRWLYSRQRDSSSADAGAHEAGQERDGRKVEHVGRAGERARVGASGKAGRPREASRFHDTWR